MAMQDDRTLLIAGASSDPDELQELAAGAARRRRRAVVCGGTAAIGAASALVVWRSLSHCRTGLDVQDSVVSLAETYPQELAQIAEASDDLDSRKQWLAEVAEASRLQKLLPIGASLPEDVQKSLESAVQSDDPDQARKVLDRAMARAVEESKAKRSALKSYIKRNRRGLKGKKDDEKSPGQQQAIATCVFDVLSATTSIAAIAANLNDAARTCWGVDPQDLFRFGLHGRAYVHTNVCAVNVWATLGGVIGLASTLSGAASDCASTMIPNVDAMCATSVTGVVTAVAGLGGASTLIKAACAKKGWYHDIMPGVVPSNVGNNDKWVDHHPDKKSQYDAEMAQQAAAMAGTLPEARRLEDEPAPARQLLFGGGKGSTATQCSVEIAQTMWALAYSAMAINNMGNQENGQSCPPTNFLTGSEKPSNSILYTVPQALCTVDVTSAILGFLSSVTYIQLATVNCIDTLNLGAICGAGISGLLAAADGVAKAGAGLYITCDVAQKKPLKKVLNVARNIDTATGGMIGGLMGGSSSDAEASPFGRRLTEDQQLMVSIVEENIKELQKKFETPHDAFRSIGVDLEDTSTPWRNATVPGVPSLSDLQGLAELLQEPKKTASLFGGKTC